MTETELLNKVTDGGWVVIETKELGHEGTGDNLLVIKGLLLCKLQDGVMLRQWANYYLKIDGTAYWREHDPFPPARLTTFDSEVRTAISGYITAGQIKAGYIEKVNSTDETAIVVVIMADDSIKMFHIYKDTSDNVQREEITGNYPL